MKTKTIQAIGAGFAATTLAAFAGDDITATQDYTSSEAGGDWCQSLKSIGTVYKNKKNPWVQEVKFFGRAHQQWGYTDGDVAGRDFSSDGDELRRLRFGGSVKFLNGFKLAARANLERGGYRDTSIRYDGWDEIYLEYGFGDLGPVEDVTLGYGRYKIGFGGEEHTSSKKIKTIERSLLNNTYAGDRGTGARLKFKVADVDFLVGVYNTDGNDETFGQWDGGHIYHLSAEFEALGGDLRLEGIYHDQNDEESDPTLGYDWAVSATYETEVGPVDLFFNTTYGSDRNGDIYGVVIMPSMELIENKLEAVFRYQWAHSTGDRLRPQSRNVRNTASFDGIGIPRGDDNHNFYAGLNYFLCGHNLKLMTGVEHEINNSEFGDTEATTLWGAVRFYF